MGPAQSAVSPRERALEAGHFVTAFTRHPGAVQRQHDRLQTTSRGVLDAAAVLRAVGGQDSVISVYGVRFDPLHEISSYSEGTCNIVQSMQEHGAARCDDASKYLHAIVW